MCSVSNFSAGDVDKSGMQIARQILIAGKLNVLKSTSFNNEILTSAISQKPTSARCLSKAV